MDLKHHVAQQTLDATIASLASKTTYTGATVTLGGGIGAIISSEPAESATLTLGGWLVSSEEREHQARMHALRGQQPGA